MRQVLDSMFSYFDTGKHWDARNGLALHVLSDMPYFLECPGIVLYVYQLYDVYYSWFVIVKAMLCLLHAN